MAGNRPTQIVVVDDEKYICHIIDEALSAEPYNVEFFCDPQRALDYIKNNPVDLVLTDLVMGDCTGIQILDTTQANHKDAIVILMTAHPTVQTAISVLKKGAYDFLVKPFKLDILKAAIERGLGHQQVLRDVVSLKGQVEFLKVANAGAAEVDIPSFLTLVVDSCKKELSACAVCVTELDPDTGEVIEEAYDAEKDECLKILVSEARELIARLKNEGGVVIRKEEIERGGVPATKTLISQPILVRGKLHGAINVLVMRRFDELTRGQLDVLSILANSAASAIANHRLYKNLKRSYLEAIRGLANAIEARDEYTAGHTDRVSRLAEVIAAELGWDRERLTNLMMGCTLHDIGKIGVPDRILNKPGSLTPEEREKMMRHPEVGLKIISEIELFRPAIPYIMAHHEWYNGDGYPGGLKQEDIPVEGRLLSVADTFDAIMSDRPYRKGRSFRTAMSELIKYRGTQFDPQIVDAFIKAVKQKKVNLKEMYGHDEDLAVIDRLLESEMVSA
ncbi:MAG: response regulator [Candidatus Zixiibacteriota bacterium]|nr:MAG: response regulator [candidate division Zixibacteria bacterium]